MELAIELARSCAGDKCTDVMILDLRGLSTVTDYFVIATGTSQRQIRAVVDHMRDVAKERSITRANVDGYEYSHWVLIDLLDIVAHVFSSEYRRVYDLELLWGDAPRVAWQAAENGDAPKQEQ